MIYFYRPKNKFERFGFLIYELLVDNFPQTFYVGGMVRDLLLRRNVTDIDIATIARPDEVIKILSKAGINADIKHKQFGVIVAKNINYSVEIATFRKDSYKSGRYPKVAFVKTAKQDAQRRDFTINALYLSQKTNTILDFHRGLEDLKLKYLIFIGNPERRIKEDPLRIIRALRFSKILKFKLEKRTENAVNKNLDLIKLLARPRIKKELDKIENSGYKKFVTGVINK